MKPHSVIKMMAMVLIWFVCSSAQAYEGRYVIAVVDVTQSFAYREQSKVFLTKIIKNTSPGDELVFINLGNFSLNQVSYYCRFPNITIDKYNNIVTYKTKKQLFQNAWQNHLKIQQKALHRLNEEGFNSQQKGDTHLHETLELVCEIIQRSAKKKYLLIFSDFLQENGKTKTYLAPSLKLDWENANIFCLFVDWKNASNFKQMEQSWAVYFNTASSFLMLDPASSILTNELFLENPDVPTAFPRFTP